MFILLPIRGDAVEALRYKPEGREFDSRLCHLEFSLTYPSGRTLALESTQPSTEMSTRGISGGLGVGRGCQCVGLTTLPLSYVDFLEILGALTSWSPKGLSRPVMG
jgi:hypothetical protein